MIPCDGCTADIHPASLSIFMLNGAQVRYCAGCAKMWREFEQTCDQEESRLQRIYDLWRADARTKVPLRVTPYDFPGIITRDGQPVTL